MVNKELCNITKVQIAGEWKTQEVDVKDKQGVLKTDVQAEDCRDG